MQDSCVAVTAVTTWSWRPDGVAWKAPCSLHRQVPQEGPLLPMPLAEGCPRSPVQGRGTPEPLTASLPAGPRTPAFICPGLGEAGTPQARRLCQTLVPVAVTWQCPCGLDLDSLLLCPRPA